MERRCSCVSRCSASRAMISRAEESVDTNDNVLGLGQEENRAVTPYRIIQILLKTTNGFLPGVQPLHHLSMSEMNEVPEVVVEPNSPDRTSSAYETEATSKPKLQQQVSPPGSTSPARVRPRPKPARLTRQTTLTLLTVGEEELRIANSSKKRDPPPPYSSLETDPTPAPISSPTPVGPRLFAAEKLDSLSRELEPEDCLHWPWFLQHRPILRLVLVMALNGLVSMACAAIFIELERPQQLHRLAEQAREETRLKMLRRQLVTLLAGYASEPLSVTRSLFENYCEHLVNFTAIPEEIEWEMLAASAFVTSVSSTTGYGDIVPVTRAGKIFTLIYALYGIPVFMWYIVKLASLLRALVMRPINPVINFFRAWVNPTAARMQRQLTNVFVAASRPVHVETDITTELLQDDKRFHPSVIGILLLSFLLSIAWLISHLEKLSYFDSFYAAFITYSTIGFGDIDIYRISYRANWFSMLIYGNGLSIVGYTLVSAWVAAILTSCRTKKKS